MHAIALVLACIAGTGGGCRGQMSIRHLQGSWSDAHSMQNLDPSDMSYPPKPAKPSPRSAAADPPAKPSQRSAAAEPVKAFAALLLGLIDDAAAGWQFPRQCWSTKGTLRCSGVCDPIISAPHTGICIRMNDVEEKSASSPWLLRPLTLEPQDKALMRAAAELAIDEFDAVQRPLLPLPGWRDGAMKQAVEEWIKEREDMLRNGTKFVWMVALDADAKQGSSFEDSLLGVMELGFEIAVQEKVKQELSREEQLRQYREQIAGKSSGDLNRKEDEYPWVANLVVREDVRRRGLGLAFMRAAEQQAVQFGGNRIYLKVKIVNDAARKLYKGLGYRTVLATSNVNKPWFQKLGDVDEGTMYMRKDLKAAPES